MSFVRRKIIREDIASRQIYEEHLEDYQIIRRHVATWQLYSEHVEGVQMLGTGPVPDVPTEYAYPRTLPAVPRIRSVTPTTAGVVGYVMIDAISATSITLRANVSGVICDVALQV